MSGLTYAAHGAPLSYLYGNTVGCSYQYNARLQPTLQQDALNNNAGAALLRLWPDWGTTNNNGNLRGLRAENGGPGYPQFLTFIQSFTYDGVNRLQTALESNNGSTTWARGFSYDPYGNLAAAGPQGIGLSPLTPVAGSVNAATNRLVSAGYDAAGNQTSVGNGVALTYDAENRQATSGDAASQLGVTYVYDALGQRVAQLGSDGSRRVSVYDAFGLLTAEYASVAQSSPCTTCYLSTDHLGSLRLVTDPNGNVVARHDYLPFGEEIYSGQAGRNVQFGAADGTRQRFTGQERDGETTPNLDYFQARSYSGEQARFLSPDPQNAGADLYNPQSWNGYAYVNNGPLTYTDPSGRSTIDPNGPRHYTLASLDAEMGGGGGQLVDPFGVFGGSSSLFSSGYNPGAQEYAQHAANVTAVQQANLAASYANNGNLAAAHQVATQSGGSVQVSDVSSTFNGETTHQITVAVFGVGVTGEPNTIIVRPQGNTPNRVSQYEYGPSGQLQYRYDWGTRTVAA